MENLIETFHIDWKIFIAQLINFTVVFAVLYWFAFKPLIKIMAERSGKISKSLEEAKLIEEKLSETRAEFEKTISEAKRQAGLILERAAAESDAKKKETVVRAKEEIGAIINQEKQKMQTEKAATLKEIRKEVADLVILTVEKVLGEKMDEKKDREMIKKLMK
ncbi:MAG: F0F1 ATP synthase subunit B [bacterium]|nr:F0F1 ATP synthase subunit B [bacterium]